MRFINLIINIFYSPKLYINAHGIIYYWIKSYQVNQMEEVLIQKLTK